MFGRRPVLKVFKAIDEAVAWFEATVLSVGILAMAAINIANVLGRNLLGTSLAFADELNQSLLVLITFIGVGYAARRARHIRMSAIYDLLGGRTRKALMVTITATTAALLLALAWFGGQYAWHIYQLGSVTPALRIPLYLVYCWVPVGLALGALQYLMTVWRNLTGRDTWLSFSERDEYESVGESGSSAAL
jgi:TRAP-type C4-dicarboxylate transport system permease small subunit